MLTFDCPLWFHTHEIQAVNVTDKDTPEGYSTDTHVYDISSKLCDTVWKEIPGMSLNTTTNHSHRSVSGRHTGLSVHHEHSLTDSQTHFLTVDSTG